MPPFPNAHNTSYSRASTIGRLISVSAAILLLGACNSSTSKSAGNAADSTTGKASASPTAVSTWGGEIIETPEGVVTTKAPPSTIAPGYSVYEPGTTVVAYLLKGEANVAVYDNATDSKPARTIERINKRTLPFVAIGNTADRVLVELPIQPNGSTGWIDKTKLELRRNDFRIEIDRSKFLLTVFDHNSSVREIPIAVGKDSTPTPDGTYYTLYVGVPPKKNGIYGDGVIGLSGFSEVLTEWKGNEPRIGLHGTNRPELIGTTASNGCIRMNNPDIDYLMKTLPLGTPVKVLT